MMRFVRWGCASMCLPLACCGDLGCSRPWNVTAAAPAQLGGADAKFIDQAARSGLTEAQEAFLALQRTTNPAVRQFAQQTVTDWTQTTQELNALAQSKHLSLPTLPNQGEMVEEKELQALTRGFDSGYVRDQVSAQQARVALFQQEAEQGTDPDVKSFAQTTLPIVQQHLSQAEALEGRLSKPGSRR